MDQERQKKRVFIIGIDGGTFDIIDPLFQQGNLPNLHNLYKRGFSASLLSTIHPVSPTAWGSFTTGVNPGKHGLYDFSKRRQDSYGQVPTTSRDIHTPSIWHLLGQKNLKMCLINIPGTYPPEPVNGFLVSGFPTPEENNDFTYPQSLLEELKDKIPDFHLQPREVIRDGNEEAILKDIGEITVNTTKTTLLLANNINWDLLITVYTGADALGHHFWRFADSNHPYYDKKLNEVYGSVINDSYIRIDQEIGKLMSLIDNNTYVIVMSDHGFGGAYNALGLNTWLLKAGWMKVRRRVISKIKYFAFRRGISLTNVFCQTKRFRTLKNRKRIYAEKSLLRNLILNLFFSTNDIDWSRTKAYCVGNCGQIHVNIIGREPQGIIPPEDRLAVVKELKSDLLSLKDDKTGERIFDNVFLREELYHGPFVEDAADIICFNSKARYLIIRYLEFGGGKLAFPHPVWSGAHRLNGILILNGPGVQTQRHTKELRLWDVTSTVLSLLGAPIADYMDGEVFTDAFHPDLLKNQLNIGIKSYPLEKIRLNIAVNHFIRRNNK
ncbi:MAG: alkaline phosphatase family protein [Candidatus Hodarchaeota archaeon]